MLNISFIRLMAFVAIFVASHVNVHAQGAKLIRMSKPTERSSEPAALGASATSSVMKMRQNGFNKRVDVVEIDVDALLSNTISLDFPDGQAVVFVKTNGNEVVGDGKIWRGTSEGGAEAAFSTDGKMVSGRIAYNGGTYSLSFLKGKYYALIQLDSSVRPADHPPSNPSGALRGMNELSRIERSLAADTARAKTKIATSTGANATVAAASSKPDIAVLVVYTPKSYSGASSNLLQGIPLAISNLNNSFANSGINLTASLAGTYAVGKDWPDINSALIIYSSLPAVKAARDKAKADVVVLIADFPDPHCGLSMEIMAKPTSAFSVVHHSCYLNDYSLAHEIGHLMGGRHNLEADPARIPYPAGHGHQFRQKSPATMGGNNVGCSPPVVTRVECKYDIMSYSGTTHPCNSNERVNYWSNPAVTYRFSAWDRIDNCLGNTYRNYYVPTGISGISNMASVLNTTGPVVASYSDSKLDQNLSAKIMTYFKMIYEDL